MINRIIHILKKNYYILTGLFMFLSFPSYDIWIFKGFPFFAWIAFIPVFVFVRDKGFKDIILYSFITAFVGNLLLYSWIGAFGANVAGGSLIVLSFLIPSLTVFIITKIIIAEYLSRRIEDLRFLIYPSVWVFIDWIQSIGFLAFPWTYWGYSQYPFTAFIQVSSFIGVIGVTFVLILTNYLLSDLIYMKQRLGLIIRGSFKIIEFKRLLLLIIFIILIVSYGWYILVNNENSKKKDFRVALIQSCISPWDNWKDNRFSYLRDLERYTNLSLLKDPDIIIWSESATLENISYSYENVNLNPFIQRVLDIARLSQKPLLTGEIGVVKDMISRRYYPQNNAVLISEDGEVVKSYPKINLVPFGEWFPYERWLPFIKELVVKFGGSDFIPGSGPMIFEVNDRNFGVLICYEGIFYRLCRTYKTLGADFLVNITNDGWTSSYSGHMQHFAASKFRAIENGIWYVRAGNTGYTALIDPYGRAVRSLPILKKAYLIGDISFELNHETFYSRYGDIFLYISMIFLFFVTVTAFSLKFKQKKQRQSRQQ